MMRSPRSFSRRNLRALSAATVASLLLMLGAAAPAAESVSLGPVQYLSLSGQKRPAISYALVRGDNTTLFVGGNAELKNAMRYRKQQPEGYLWVRKAEQQYLLSDPVVLAEMLEPWQKLSPYEQDMSQLEQQLDRYTDELEEHSEALEAALEDDDLPDQRAIAEFEKVSEPLQAKIEPLADQIEDLGAQIEQLSEDAHLQTLARIQQAISDGSARPVP